MSGFMRKALSIFAGKVFSLLIGVVSGIVVSRSLGPSGRGELAVVLLVPTLATALGSLGLGPAVIYFHGTRPNERADLLTTMLVLGSAWGTVLLALSWFSRFLLAGQNLGTVPPGLLFFVFATIPLTLIGQFCGHYVLAQGNLRWYNVTAWVAPAGYTFVVLLALGFRHLTVSAAITAWSLSQMLGSVPVILYTLHKVRPLGMLSIPLAKDLIRYGLKSHVMVVLNYLNYRIDVLLLTRLSSSEQIGHYSLAVSLAELIWFAPSSIGTVLFPEISSGRNRDSHLLTAKLIRFALAIGGVAALGLAILGRPFIVFVYSQAFSQAYFPLLALLPGVVALSVFKVVASDVAGRGKPLEIAWGTGIALVINIAANFALIPRFGATGAGISSSISYTVATVMTVMLFARLTRCSIARELLPSRQDVALAASLFRRTKGSATGGGSS